VPPGSLVQPSRRQNSPSHSFLAPPKYSHHHLTPNEGRCLPPLNPIRPSELLSSPPRAQSPRQIMEHTSRLQQYSPESRFGPSSLQLVSQRSHEPALISPMGTEASQAPSPSFSASKSMQAKVGKLPQKTLSPPSPSTTANKMKSSLCPPSPPINTCLAHRARSHTNSNSVAEAIRNLRIISLVNTPSNRRKIEQAEQDAWLLIGPIPVRIRLGDEDNHIRYCARHGESDFDALLNIKLSQRLGLVQIQPHPAAEPKMPSASRGGDAQAIVPGSPSAD
jgi:hypothetical protein